MARYEMGSVLLVTVVICLNVGVPVCRSRVGFDSRDRRGSCYRRGDRN